MILLHRKHIANEIYFATAERFIANRTCVSEKINLVEYAFPPIRINRYAHDDSTDFVSTSKINGKIFVDLFSRLLRRGRSREYWPVR